MGKSKIVHTELKGNISKRFEIIKLILGIQNDAEVIRFLIQYYYRENLEGDKLLKRVELERDKDIIDEYMKKYGEQWRRLGEDE